MCDTLVSLSEGTHDGSVVFGKNSDRPDDEVQLITFRPKKSYSEGEMLKCTYIEIPQAKETYEVLLSQPWWMWGAEMGANEYGVTIGNEAVHTFEPIRHIGLLGMDLLRLGLERGKNAREALDIITDLLEHYHQGGGCAYGDSGWSYHNSFLIADPENAYVLETADDWWVAEEVKDVRSISNGLSIRGKGDLRKKDIIQHAIERGYCQDDEDFDFALSFSGSAGSNSPYSRGGRTQSLLDENKGKITPKLMMEFLRDHQAGVCMHGGFESTGSQVSHLKKEKKSIHWFTGTTLPCLSIYKPYIFPAEDFIHENPGPYSEIDPQWFWSVHTDLKSRSLMSRGEKVEPKLVQKVKKLVSQEESLSDYEFVNKMRSLNHSAWKKSKELIEK